MMEQRPNLRKLTGPQLRTVLEAAQQLRGEPFFRLVAIALADRAELGDGAVDRAIRTALKELHCERKVTL
jgi:hypothetical protein